MALERYRRWLSQNVSFDPGTFFVYGPIELEKTAPGVCGDPRILTNKNKTHFIDCMTFSASATYTPS